MTALIRYVPLRLCQVCNIYFSYVSKVYASHFGCCLGVIKRVYNIHNKQLLKVFALVLNCDQDQMSDHLDQSGDISLTIEHFFLNAKSDIEPIAEISASLTIVDIDKFLG